MPVRLGGFDRAQDTARVAVTVENPIEVLECHADGFGERFLRPPEGFQSCLCCMTCYS